MKNITITSAATITVPAKYWPAVLRILTTLLRTRNKGWPTALLTSTRDLPVGRLIDLARPEGDGVIGSSLRAGRYLHEVGVQLDRSFQGDLEFIRAAPRQTK